MMIKTRNSKADRSSLHGSIRGAILLPPDLSELGGVSVEAFADRDLKDSVGRSVTNDVGCFVIDVESETVSSQIWFRWTRGAASGRTPLLNPHVSSDGVFRIPCYEATSAESGSRRQAAHKGRIRSQSGPAVPNVTVWLVEQTLRHAQRISAGESDPTGFYEIHYDQANLLDANRADLRVVVFNATAVPLVETAQHD